MENTVKHAVRSVALLGMKRLAGWWRPLSLENKVFSGLLALILVLAVAIVGQPPQAVAVAAALPPAGRSVDILGAPTASARTDASPIATLRAAVKLTPEPTLDPTLAPTLKPTPEPTLKPTPEPTLKPTPEPTLKPTPEPDLRWTQFVDHVTGSSSEASDILQAIGIDSEAFDVDSLAVDFSRLEMWGTIESNWLSDHPAGACYKTAWTHWKAVATDSVKAGTLGYAGAVNLDADALTSAAHWINLATTNTSLASGDIDDAAAACE
jgi:hypothetical protein